MLAWAEPLLGRLAGPPDATTDPSDRITLDESVNMAFLIVLESMTSAERVAFILHDVFRYPFGDVAEIVGPPPEPVASWPGRYGSAPSWKRRPRP